MNHFDLGADGELACEGVPLRRIADAVGTPPPEPPGCAAMPPPPLGLALVQPASANNTLPRASASDACTRGPPGTRTLRSMVASDAPRVPFLGPNPRFLGTEGVERAP